MKIDQPNQAWCTDITNISVAKGFLYLVAIMGWHFRKVFSWRFSNTMDVHFCPEVPDEIVARFGAPEIFNSNQGSQFTSEAFTGALKKNGIRISMGGKGCCMEREGCPWYNIFIERLRRSLKHEEVLLKACDSVAEARQRIDQWMQFYNLNRRHQGLNDQTPDSVCFGGLDMPLAA